MNLLNIIESAMAGVQRGVSQRELKLRGAGVGAGVGAIVGGSGGIVGGGLGKIATDGSSGIPMPVHALTGAGVGAAILGRRGYNIAKAHIAKHKAKNK